MNDSLGDRMKSYEAETRSVLEKKRFTIIRLDGKSFHRFTKNLDRPYDHRMSGAMMRTASFLLNEVQGCRISYTQSDEITLVLSDMKRAETESWFGGNVQKMASVSASMATWSFQEEAASFRSDCVGAGLFDSRVFQVPNIDEAVNNLVWRYKDCTRNSVQMLAQSVFSHKELQGISTLGVLEMLSEAGIAWTECASEHRFGNLLYRDGRNTVCGDLSSVETLKSVAYKALA